MYLTIDEIKEMIEMKQKTLVDGSVQEFHITIIYSVEVNNTRKHNVDWSAYIL